MESDTNIYSNVLLEIKKHYMKNTYSLVKVECFYFICNILQYCTQKNQEKLIKGNLLGIIHDELYQDLAGPRQIMLMIEALNTLFEKFEGLSAHFIKIYGTDALEHLQFSQQEPIQEKALELITKFFDTEDEDLDQDMAGDREQLEFKI